jgi:hypothetical protein
MAKRKNNNFPVIIKHEKFTRIGESIVFQIKGGLWRYKNEDRKKIDFSSRLGAVSYAVAEYIGGNKDNRRVDDSLGKHKNDAMFHTHFLKEAHKRKDEDAIILYQTRLELSQVGWADALRELKELSKAMNIV